MHSLFDNALGVKAVSPIAASSAQTSAAIDTLGFDTAMVLVNNGVATGSPSSYTVDAKVQECDTSGGSYTDVPGAAITQITADSAIAAIALNGLNQGARKRYIKVVVTPALTGGSTPKALICSSVLFGRGKKGPVGNVQ